MRMSRGLESERTRGKARRRPQWVIRRLRPITRSLHLELTLDAGGELDGGAVDHAANRPFPLPGSTARAHPRSVARRSNAVVFDTLGHGVSPLVHRTGNLRKRNPAVGNLSLASWGRTGGCPRRLPGCCPASAGRRRWWRRPSRPPTARVSSRAAGPAGETSLSLGQGGKPPSVEKIEKRRVWKMERYSRVCGVRRITGQSQHEYTRRRPDFWLPI